MKGSYLSMVDDAPVSTAMWTSRPPTPMRTAAIHVTSHAFASSTLSSCSVLLRPPSSTLCSASSAPTAPGRSLAAFPAFPSVSRNSPEDTENNYVHVTNSVNANSESQIPTTGHDINKKNATARSDNNNEISPTNIRNPASIVHSTNIYPSNNVLRGLNHLAEKK